MFRQFSMQARVAVPGASGQLDAGNMDNMLYICDGTEYSAGGPVFTSSPPRYVNPHHQPTEAFRSHLQTTQVQQPQPQNITSFSSSQPYDCSSGQQRRIAELSAASAEPVSAAVKNFSTGPITQAMFAHLQTQQRPNALNNTSDTREDSAVAAMRPTVNSPYPCSDETPNSLLHCSQPVQPLHRISISPFNSRFSSSLLTQQIHGPTLARHSSSNVSGFADASAPTTQATPNNFQSRGHIAVPVSGGSGLTASTTSTTYGTYDKPVAFTSLNGSGSVVLQQAPQSPPPGSWCAAYEPHNAYGAYVSGYGSNGAGPNLALLDSRGVVAAASTIPATEGPFNNGNFFHKDFPRNSEILFENSTVPFPAVGNEVYSISRSAGYHASNSDTGALTDGPSPHRAALDSGRSTALPVSSGSAVQPPLTASQPTPTAKLTRPARVSFANGIARDAASPDSLQACTSADDSTAPYRPGGSTTIPLRIAVPTVRSSPTTPAAAATVTTPSSELETLSCHQPDLAYRRTSNTTLTSAAVITPYIRFPFGGGLTAPSQGSASPQEVPVEADVMLPAPVTVQVASRCRRTDETGTTVRGRVTRGAVGVFHPKLYLAGGDCIQCEDELMSRGRFERLAGTATAKWHVSIKVVPSGMTLGKWLQMHGLPVLQGRPRKRRAGTDDDRDADGDDDFSGPLQPLSQPQASQPHPPQPQSPSRHLTQCHLPQTDPSVKRESESHFCQQQQPANGQLHAPLPALEPVSLPCGDSRMSISAQEQPSPNPVANSPASIPLQRDVYSTPPALAAESTRNTSAGSGSNLNNVTIMATVPNRLPAEVRCDDPIEPDMESVFALLDNSTLDDLLMASGDPITATPPSQPSSQHNSGNAQSQKQQPVPPTTNDPSQPPTQPQMAPMSQPQRQETTQYTFATPPTPNPSGPMKLQENSNNQMPLSSCPPQMDNMHMMTRRTSVNVPILSAAAQPITGLGAPLLTTPSSATMTTTTHATTITTGLSTFAQQPPMDPMRPNLMTGAIVNTARVVMLSGGNISLYNVRIESNSGTGSGNGGYYNNGGDGSIDGSAVVYGKERSTLSSSSLCLLPMMSSVPQQPCSVAALPSTNANVNMPPLPSLSSHGSCYEAYDNQDPEAVRQIAPYASGDRRGSGGSGSMGPWANGYWPQGETAGGPNAGIAAMASASGGVISKDNHYSVAGGGDGFNLLQSGVLAPAATVLPEQWPRANESVRYSNGYSSSGNLSLPMQAPQLPQPPSTLCWFKTGANGTTEPQGWMMPSSGPQSEEWRVQALQEQKPPQWQSQRYLQEQQLTAPSMPMSPTARCVLGATAWKSMAEPSLNSTRSVAELPHQMPQMQFERAVQQESFAVPMPPVLNPPMAG